MKTTKYSYTKVIQQLYASAYGWEDVSEYESNSAGIPVDRAALIADLKEYKLLGYPTRVVLRRSLNTVNA